ncbi:U-scoloptoxin(01)-Er1a like protein [Argiope bruennichi]|uniref:U-scoloptoxin(01)-Er1a like protein n=1 Tax=Argiope bruennichi TaxID=94029 RepID=A0A8T0F1Q8_ARGBR|nr:U-scoloptoxin(01)-Er1a like protein [Argiope bruennichi]
MALIISVDESKPEDTDAVISDLNLEEQSALPIYRTKAFQYPSSAVQPLPDHKQLGYILDTPENNDGLKNVNSVIVDKPKYLIYPSGPSSEIYESSRNSPPEYSFKLKYPLSPSNEAGEQHYSPRNKYPERPAPPLISIPLNRTISENNNDERLISSAYDSPVPSQYGSYESEEYAKPFPFSDGVKNTYENLKDEENDYSSSMWPYKEPKETLSHQQFPIQREPVPYSKPYYGGSHESYSPEKSSKSYIHNSNSSPHELPYDPKSEDYTSLYSAKPRVPPKFKYYSGPETANDYLRTHGSEAYSTRPYSETPEIDLSKQSLSTYEKPHSEPYISSKDTVNIKDNPISYVSYNDPTYGTRASPVSHTIPHLNIETSEPTYQSGDYVSKEDPYTRTNAYSSNYESEHHTRKRPINEAPTSYQSDINTNLQYDKLRSTSAEEQHSGHKAYDYSPRVRNAESSKFPYVSEQYEEKSLSTPGKTSKQASSSYDTYDDLKYPVADEIPSGIEGKDYDSSVIATKSYSPYEGSPESKKSIISRFYNTPSHFAEKTSSYITRYPDTAPKVELPKSSYHNSAKPFKYSIVDADSPEDTSYYKSPSKPDSPINTPSYYNSPQGIETSEIRSNHSVRKNYRSSRPAPLNDEYDQPRHPPLPKDPNDSSEKYFSYENVENKPITDYGKSSYESSYPSTYKQPSYKMSYTDDQNGKYYPSSSEFSGSHYSSPKLKEYADKPEIYTKTITETYSKPNIISDDYHEDRSSESQYNRPNINVSPVSDSRNLNDKTYSYSSNPNSYSKPYSYSYPEGSSEEYSYANPSKKNEEKFSSYAESDEPESSYTYSREKQRPKRVEGVVYRQRKNYPDLPNPRRQKSYLPYKSYNPRTAQAFDYKVYESSPDKNLTNSPRKSFIKLKYKPVKKDFSQEDKSVYDNNEDSSLSNIPGEPGKDFPILKIMPYTHFSCENRAPGFYADTQHRCQVYYQCSDKGRMQSFLCPNGTIFNQETFVCEWWHNVDCSKSEKLFSKNHDLYKPNTSSPREHVDAENYHPSGRNYVYGGGYPASDEHSDNYRPDEDSRRRRYAKLHREKKLNRNEVNYNTPSL